MKGVVRGGQGIGHCSSALSRTGTAAAAERVGEGRRPCVVLTVDRLWSVGWNEGWQEEGMW